MKLNTKLNSNQKRITTLFQAIIIETLHIISRPKYDGLEGNPDVTMGLIFTQQIYWVNLSINELVIVNFSSYRLYNVLK